MRIHLFGRLRDGPPVAPVPETVTDLDTLRAWLAPTRPELVADSVRIALNDEMVFGNRSISDEDEIAFLPPVSGG